MLSLWANWLQLNSQLNSWGVSFCLYRTCTKTDFAVVFTMYKYPFHTVPFSRQEQRRLSKVKDHPQLKHNSPLNEGCCHGNKTEAAKLDACLFASIDVSTLKLRVELSAMNVGQQMDKFPSYSVTRNSSFFQSLIPSRIHNQYRRATLRFDGTFQENFVFICLPTSSTNLSKCTCMSYLFRFIKYMSMYMYIDVCVHTRAKKKTFSKAGYFIKTYMYAKDSYRLNNVKCISWYSAILVIHWVYMYKEASCF